MRVLDRLPPSLRSVRARLSIALAVVVAAALAVVYAIVVPRLEQSLMESRLDELAAAAQLQQVEYRSKVAPYASIQGLLVDVFLDQAEEATQARVVIFKPLAQRLRAIADSRGTEPSRDIEKDEIALRAALSGVPERGIVKRGGERFAEIAFPEILGTGDLGVVLYSAPLDDTLSDVSLIERRLLGAGLAALIIAVLIGYVGATAFARRIRRLERAADRIAGGDLDEPVVDTGSDELAQLARTFERMRGRLAQLERARREFVANASHELRTPLFALSGFLELLADEELDEPTRREFLATMQEQSDRLTKLATELLDLSRIDAGRLTVQREPVDLAAVCDTVAEEFAVVARRADHPIIVEAREAVAVADEQRVLQIARILVENAILHTRAGTAVRLHAGTRAGRAVLAVEDDGQGIAADDLGQIFDRFYRVDGARASGSGLGLAIGRELAELMGGALDVTSDAGRTRFELTLPLAPARVAKPELAVAR